MSEMKSPRGTLVEAADRFDRLARVLKDQQLAETRSGPRIAAPASYVASPDEVWSKKFASQAIGPAAAKLDAPSLSTFPTAFEPPPRSFGLQASQAAPKDLPVRPELTKPVEPLAAGPIGGRIGRSQKRRSWFSRFFFGA
jgi:hypothetical protein